MLDLFGGLLSLFLNPSPTAPVQSANWSSVVNESIVRSLITTEPDPVAEAILDQHLKALTASGFAGGEQGVWIQMGDQVLAEHLGTTPLSAASLTKIPTTLVALSQWGPEHQFETIVSTNGRVQSGVLQGNLVIQGGSDPLFVWEEAIALSNALNQLGIQRVTGDLIITGDFAMNFETNPITAGNLLKQGLDTNLWTAEIEAQYQQMAPNTPRPQVAIEGTVRVATASDADRSVTPLIRHQSLPMVNILKGMNIYSNNIIADMLAKTLGGANSVAQQAAELAYVPPEEIQLVNGSGLGEANRISPRAATAMLITIQQYLQPRQLNVSDIFPVIGRDGGTLQGRQIPQGSVLKTGTLDEVSSLAGVVPTHDRGLIWFTVINLGSGDLSLLHAQQDLLLERFQKAWNPPSPFPPSIQPNRAWQDSYQLGASDRNLTP